MPQVKVADVGGGDDGGGDLVASAHDVLSVLAADVIFRVRTPVVARGPDLKRRPGEALAVLANPVLVARVRIRACRCKLLSLSLNQNKTKNKNKQRPPLPPQPRARVHPRTHSTHAHTRTHTRAHTHAHTHTRAQLTRDVGTQVCPSAFPFRALVVGGAFVPVVARLPLVAIRGLGALPSRALARRLALRGRARDLPAPRVLA